MKVGKKLFDYLIPAKDDAGKTHGYLLVVLDGRVFEKSFNEIKD
jgi:hypothetical protein